MTRTEYYSLIRQENKERKSMKKLIRLTESDLHRIVKESVNRVLNEDLEDIGLRVASTIEHKVEDFLRQSNFEYDGGQGELHVYLDDNTVVTIKIYKEGNIPYHPQR